VSSKPVTLRPLANEDIEQAVDHYLDAAGAETALRFVDALERAYEHIARHPAAGSPRYGSELGLPGLRHWPLQRFPYLIFYVERVELVDFWRVLHGGRDIPASMTPETN